MIWNKWNKVLRVTCTSFMLLYETKYSKIDRAKFMKDSLYEIWSDMVCLSRQYWYYFKFSKGCLPQILFGPILNIFSHMINICLSGSGLSALSWLTTNLMWQNGAVILFSVIIINFSFSVDQLKYIKTYNAKDIK